jgi:hypothetical protein
VLAEEPGLARDASRSERAGGNLGGFRSPPKKCNSIAYRTKLLDGTEVRGRPLALCDLMLCRKGAAVRIPAENSKRKPVRKSFQFISPALVSRAGTGTRMISPWIHCSELEPEIHSRPETYGYSVLPLLLDILSWAAVP